MTAPTAEITGQSAAEAAADLAPLTIGTRVFVILPWDALTVEQDAWISSKLERAGLMDPRLQRLRPAARASEIRCRILESGHIADLAAGYLVDLPETGTPSWSTAAAVANARYLRSQTGADARAVVLAVARGAVTGLFPFAGPSESPTDSPSESPADLDDSTPNSSARASGDGSSRASELSSATTLIGSPPE